MTALNIEGLDRSEKRGTKGQSKAQNKHNGLTTSNSYILIQENKVNIPEMKAAFSVKNTVADLDSSCERQL